MLDGHELDRLAQLGMEYKLLREVGADECDLGEAKRVAATQRFKAKLLQYGERLISQAREANRLREENAVALNTIGTLERLVSEKNTALASQQQVVEAAKAWGDADSDDPVGVLACELGLSNALTRLTPAPSASRESEVLDVE